VFRRLFICFLMLAVAAVSPVAAAQKKSAGPAFIRDAEIEGLLRLYARPIFKAAGLNPSAVRVVLINDGKINAFVAGGQRIFVHTGLLTQSKTPNEVIGVLAHETGHIAGGHLSRIRQQIDNASTMNIIGMLLGAAAMAGGAVSGNGEVAKAGQGAMIGGASLGQRTVLSYVRSMEASADQAALKYLTATGQSGQGMLTLFQKLANQSIGSLKNIDPYVQSHPMPMERIRNLEREAKASASFRVKDKPEMMLRHELMQAKLVGFIQPGQINNRYARSDKSLPARYARAIAAFRSGDTNGAVAIIDGLIDELPQNPYFWELKGQALVEGGQPAKAVAPLRKAVELLPSNGLLQIALAQALLGTENPKNAEAALKALGQARKTEADNPTLYRFSAMAYGLKGDIPRADLATAEFAFARGDKELAAGKSRQAMAKFKKGTPDWTRANDILTLASRK
jgi:predicted Zn-dependent protease